VKLPLSVIAACLQDYSIIYFKSSQHDPKAPPHYHITVPINDDLSLLLCLITSEVENKVWYYRKTNGKAIDSLVKVNPETLPFLKKESIVECNQPILIRKSELSRLVDDKHSFKMINCEVPSGVRSKLISAIKNSPIVKPFIKKLLK
jgi:hypothetical protein